MTYFYETLHGTDEADAEAASTTLVFQSINSLHHKLQTMKNDIEQTSIKSINQAAFVNLESLLVVLELALGIAVNCDNTESIIGNFTEKLDEQTLDDLMQITQDVLQKYGKKDADATDMSMSQTMPDSSQVGETLIDDMGYNQAQNRSQTKGGAGASMTINTHDRGEDDGDPDALDRGDGGADRSRDDGRPRTPRSARRNANNKSGMDVSLDAGYMNRVDEIEDQNRN